MLGLRRWTDDHNDVMEMLTISSYVHMDMTNLKPLELVPPPPLQHTGNYLVKLIKTE